MDLDTIKKGLSYALDEYVDEAHPMFKFVLPLAGENLDKCQEMIEYINKFVQEKQINNVVLSHVGSALLSNFSVNLVRNKDQLTLNASENQIKAFAASIFISMIAAKPEFVSVMKDIIISLMIINNVVEDGVEDFAQKLEDKIKKVMAKRKKKNK